MNTRKTMNPYIYLVISIVGSNQCAGPPTQIWFTTLPTIGAIKFHAYQLIFAPRRVYLIHFQWCSTLLVVSIPPRRNSLVNVNHISLQGTSRFVNRVQIDQITPTSLVMALSQYISQGTQHSPMAAGTTSTSSNKYNLTLIWCIYSKSNHQQPSKATTWLITLPSLAPSLPLPHPMAMLWIFTTLPLLST